MVRVNKASYVSTLKFKQSVTKWCTKPNQKFIIYWLSNLNTIGMSLFEILVESSSVTLQHFEKTGYYCYKHVFELNVGTGTCPHDLGDVTYGRDMNFLVQFVSLLS